MLYCTHPKPGTAFTYKEWESGLHTHNGKPAINMLASRPITLAYLLHHHPPPLPHQPANHLPRTQPPSRHQNRRHQAHAPIPVLPGLLLDYPRPSPQKQTHTRVLALGISTSSAQKITESTLSFRQETHIAPRYVYSYIYVFPLRTALCLHQAPGAYYIQRFYM